MTHELGVYDDPYAPTLLSKAGEPFEGETLVEFDSYGAPIHFFDERKAAQRTSRIVAWFRAVEFDGELLPRYYPVFCDCANPALNSECNYWRPKGGRSNLYSDAAIALGRLPRKGDKLRPSKLFRDKLFKAQISVVKSDRGGKPIPRPLWHSRLGRLLELEAGGPASSLPDPSTSTDTSPSSATKTSAFPTTKMARDNSISEEEFPASPRRVCTSSSSHEGRVPGSVEPRGPVMALEVGGDAESTIRESDARGSGGK
jgi:hypothetical protein